MPQNAVPPAQGMHHQLLELQSEFVVRPFGIWHRSPFVAILARNFKRLCAAGVSDRSVLQQLRVHHETQSNLRSNFQTAVVDMIRLKAMKPYDPTQRARHKLAR